MQFLCKQLQSNIAFFAITLGEILILTFYTFTFVVSGCCYQINWHYNPTVQAVFLHSMSDY